jgi:hypothetical protein
MNINEIVSDLEAKLAAFEVEHDGLGLRDKVLRLVAVLKSTRQLNVAVLRDIGIDAKAARERIRLYMIRYVGMPLDAIELEIVSGISEYGRRIRELRVQDGYTIVSGPKDDDETKVSLKRNQYMLIRAEPDITAARRWHIANRIRKDEGSGRDRILHYLQVHVGQIVTTEEIAYVARVADYPRRIRALRTEEGYAISTCFTGRPDLRPGEYVLERKERIVGSHNQVSAAEVHEKDQS